MTDLKKALITGGGKWLSTGVSKNGMTTAQYAYYDEMNGWNDIDIYVPFTAPMPPVEFDIRIGEYMIKESSESVRSDLEKAYRKLVDDKAIADATIEAYKEKFANPYPAARLGYIDDIIQPCDARSMIIKALDMAHNKNESNPPKKHGNMPL